ncbi:hypothetical protein GCM10027168_53830 [Streptomyces capparidis]
MWYRSGGTSRQYARQVEGAVLRLTADGDSVDRATLRRAARQAHRADGREPDELLPEDGGGGAGGRPVERGDLPPVGDGAPRDPEGASG